MSEMAIETPAETPQAVVIVTPTIMDGTVVRWYRAVEHVDYHHGEVLSASRNGVLVCSSAYLHTIPPEWISDATVIWQALRIGKDVSRWATHRTRFGRSEVEPIERAETVQ